MEKTDIEVGDEILIVSDGIGSNTSITLDGKQICCIDSVEVSITPYDRVKAKLSCISTKIDAKAVIDEIRIKKDITDGIKKIIDSFPDDAKDWDKTDACEAILEIRGLFIHEGVMKETNGKRS